MELFTDPTMWTPFLVVYDDISLRLGLFDIIHPNLLVLVARVFALTSIRIFFF